MNPIGEIRFAKFHPDGCACAVRTAYGRTWNGCAPAIAIYDNRKRFVTRIEFGEDVDFLSEVIVAALKRISEEQAARKSFVSEPEPGEIVGAAV